MVEAPAASPEPHLESSVQPPAPFTMGQAREQCMAAAGGPATTVTWSAPAVSAVAPVVPRVSTSVVLPSGTVTVALPGRPQVPLGRGFLPASRMASAATQAPGRIVMPRAPVLPRTPSPAPAGNPDAWQHVPHRNRAPAQSQQPRRTEAPSVHEHQLNHVPATRAAQWAESVSASTTPPSSAKAMKMKRGKPSQLARESRLRKCFNCAKGAIFPWSAPAPATSAAFQGIILHSATPAPRPSLGRGLLALSTFLPLRPVGRGAQLLAALNKNWGAAASVT